jgi:zinc transport system substrate-binding protein
LEITMNIRHKTAAAFLFLVFSMAYPACAEIRVLASIKPVHSLVASVMKGVATPELLVTGTASPHTYSLKPSDAEALSKADLVIWVGPELETFLATSMTNLARPETSFALGEVSGLEKLPPRTGPTFADDGDHDTVDPHYFLGIDNARKMTAAIADRLEKLDPAHADQYQKNAQATQARLDTLQADLRKQLAPAGNAGFIVFHDAYQYFEKSFAIRATGAIGIHPDSQPSAAALATMRQEVMDNKVKCVFSEPQFDARLVTVITEGTQAKTGVLDPEATQQDPGPDLYFNAMEALARSLADCLSG